MEGAPTPDSDEQFAEWYVWAKREVSPEPRVCLGVAQAAVEASSAGADRAAVEEIARHSVAGHAVMLLPKVSPWRQGYAQWYDWVRLEFGGDPPRLHRLARAAIETLKVSGDASQAAEAARAAANADPPAVRVPFRSGSPPSGGSGTAGGWGAGPSAASAPGSVTPAAGPRRPVRFEPIALAGFWRRLAAGAIDAVLCVIGMFLVFVVVQIFVDISILSNRTQVSNLEALLIDLAVLIMWAIVIWLYFAGLESGPSQATPGKRAMRLIVVDRYGLPVKFGRATGRHFGKLISLACVGVGFFMIGWTAQKQGLHDLMADTRVVRRNHLSRVIQETPPAPPVPTWANPPAPTTGVAGQDTPVLGPETLPH